MSNLNITITETAQVYLRELLAKQNSDGIAVRIFVENAGTPKAECGMAYCMMMCAWRWMVLKHLSNSKALLI